jgi:hypothetical protein
VILVAGFFVLTSTGSVTLPAVAYAAVAYGCYRFLRAMLLMRAGPSPSIHAAQTAANLLREPATALRFGRWSRQERHEQHKPLHAANEPAAPATGSAAETPAVAAAPISAPKRRSSSWNNAKAEQATPAMLVKSRPQIMTELTGSLLAASIIAILLSAGMAMLMRGNTGPEQFTWLVIVSIAGSWAVLIPSKLWEGTQGEPLLRRLVMLVAGLLVGWLAYQLDLYIRVDLPWDPHLRVPAVVDGYSYTLNSVYGFPLQKCYLMYFGLLFGVMRWWRQANPLRKTRLSLWSTVVCMFVGWVLGAICPFPQPWGVMVAATMAISVQLATPWIDTRRIAQETA